MQWQNQYLVSGQLQKNLSPWWILSLRLWYGHVISAQQISCFDSWQLIIITWISNIKEYLLTVKVAYSLTYIFKVWGLAHRHTYIRESFNNQIFLDEWLPNFLRYGTPLMHRTPIILLSTNAPTGPITVRLRRGDETKWTLTLMNCLPWFQCVMPCHASWINWLFCGWLCSIWRL